MKQNQAYKAQVCTTAVSSKHIFARVIPEVPVLHVCALQMGDVWYIRVDDDNRTNSLDRIMETARLGPLPGDKHRGAHRYSPDVIGDTLKQPLSPRRGCINADDKRVKLAEHQGWKFDWTAAGCHVTEPGEEMGSWNPTDGRPGHIKRFLDMSKVPAYFSDIMAAADLIKTLAPSRLEEFQKCLIAQSKRDGVSTAARWAEAFGQSHLLWTEEE